MFIVLIQFIGLATVKFKGSWELCAQVIDSFKINRNSQVLLHEPKIRYNLEQTIKTFTRLGRNLVVQSSQLISNRLSISFRFVTPRRWGRL